MSVLVCREDDGGGRVVAWGLSGFVVGEFGGWISGSWLVCVLSVVLIGGDVRGGSVLGGTVGAGRRRSMVRGWCLGVVFFCGVLWC